MRSHLILRHFSDTVPGLYFVEMLQNPVYVGETVQKLLLLLRPTQPSVSVQLQCKISALNIN